MNASNLMHGAAPKVAPREVPCEHLVQFYEADEDFLDTLERFVRGGLSTGESAIVIATPEHRWVLEQRLAAHGLDIADARARDQYIPLDAEQTLGFFMRDGRLNDERFFKLVRALLTLAGNADRKVRAFGEMVAIMWARGERDATVRLEYLWHQLCASEGFSLLCAYPKAAFAQNASSIDQICAAHSKVLPH
jgi:hypothetical protein